MKYLKTKWKRFFPGVLFLFLALELPVHALEINRVRDLYFYGEEKEAGLVLLMKSRPAYSVRERSTGESVVFLENTESSSRVLERIHKNSWPLGISRHEKKNLKCVLKASGKVREVRTTWLADRKLFYLQFFLKKHSASGGDTPIALPDLKGVRFGVRKHYTRTVLAFGGKPQWALSFWPEKGFTLELRGGKAYTKRRNFGPISRLRRLQINEVVHGLAVILAPEGNGAFARVFWLDKGNRLVMDFFDEPDLAALTAQTLPKDFGKNDKRARLAARKMRTGEPLRKDTPSDKKKAGQKDVERKLIPAIPETVLVPDITGTEKSEQPSGIGEGPFLRRPIGNSPQVPREEKKTVMKVQKEKRIVGHKRPAKEDQIGRKLLALPVKAEEAQKLDPEEALAYGKIWKARELKRFGEASILIDQFLTRFPLSPKSEELLFLKGDILLSRLKRGEKGLLSEVIEAYRQAISRSQNTDKVIAAYMKTAKANSLTGNDMGAVSFLNLAIKHCRGCPGGAPAYLERGRLLMKAGEPEKAVLDFKEVLVRYPSTRWAASALFGVAQYFHKKGLYQNAETRMEKIAALDHDFWLKRPDFLSLRAQNFLYLKKYERARTLFFKALNVGARQKGKDVILTHIGDTFLYQFHPKEAEKMYKQVVKDFPGSEGASIAELRLADMYFDVEAFKKVRDLKKGGLTEEITDLKIANAYYNGGRFKMAMDSLKSLASKPPQDSVTAAARELFRRAAEKRMKKLYRNGEFSSLVETFRNDKGLLKDRIDPETQLLVAMSLQKLEKVDDAILSYESLNPLDLGPERLGPYYLGLAQCYAKAGDTPAMVNLLEKGRREKLLEKDRFRVTLLLADQYKIEQEYPRAKALYTRLIDSRGHFSTEQMSRVYLSLGETLNKLGKYQKARAYFQRSIALSERDRKAKSLYFLGLGALGDSFLGDGKYGEAIIRYEKAFRIEAGKALPEYWGFRLGQAEALMATGEMDAASTLLSAFYEGHGPGPRFWALKYRLAKRYQNAGKVDKAEVQFREISEEGTAPLQTEAQLQLGSLVLQRNLKKLSIWPEIGGQRVQHARQ